MSTSFTKMEGLGNEFIVLRGPLQISTAKSAIAKYCSRSSGVGADGLLIVRPISNRNVEMRYWNADGSVAEMCGNGLRCVVRYAVDNKLVEPGEITVNTDAGPLKATWDGKDPSNIEVQVGRVVINPEPTILEGKYFYIVSVGNPHAVTFVDGVEQSPVTTLGPVIENNPNFPHKTNVEFVEVVSPKYIKIRVWERGVGETKACGTGMVAAARLSKEIKKTELPVTVEVRGGKAKVWLDNKGYCRMSGPANVVSSGEL